MELLEQIFANKKKRLLLASNFKNRFLKLWAEHGTLSTDYEGRVYLNRFRLSGQGVGAIEMSKLFRQPDLHNTVDDDSCISSVDIVLNFNKLIEIDETIINAFLVDYKSQLQNKSFDKLYYRFNINGLEDAYFLRKEVLSDNSIIYVKIEDVFLTELAELISHRKFIEYDGVFPIDTSSNSIIQTRVTFIEYSEEVSFSIVNSLMDSLIDYTVAIPGPHGIIGDRYIFTLLAIRDRILSFAYNQEFGTDVFSDMEQIFIFNSKYYLDINKAKSMNAESFLKLITKALDFSPNKKDSCRWLISLLAITTFVVGIVVIMATGNVAGGFAIITGGIGALTDSPELQILSAVLSLGATSLESEAFTLASIGYEEAVSLVLNVSSLYFTLTTPRVQKEEESLTTDSVSHLLFEAPTDIYDTIYEYKSLTSVSTDLNE